MGVVHTPSAQQHAEIRRVIASANPDVVVIEIDQMRLDTLLAADNTMSYGGELATAASAAAAAGSVIILGDARAKDSINALLQPGWPIDPGRAFRGLQMAVDAATQPPPSGVYFVNVPAALRDDVAKLGPILGAMASSVAMIFASTALSASGMQQGPASTSLLVATFAIMMRVLDVLLLSRDDVLAASTVRALRISQGLQSGELIRRRWTFETDPASLASERASMPMPDGAIPFFTLKRPIAEGESRRPKSVRAAGGWLSHGRDCSWILQTSPSSGRPLDVFLHPIVSTFLMLVGLTGLRFIIRGTMMQWTKATPITPLARPLTVSWNDLDASQTLSWPHLLVECGSQR